MELNTAENTVRKRSIVCPRRLPKQQRAKVTVDAILQATAMELTRKGYKKITTYRIAEIAGVSIGSLYEYFPSKASLLAALIETQLQLLSERLRENLLACTMKTLEELAEAIAAAFCDTYGRDEALSRILIAGTPRVITWRRLEHYSFARISLIKKALGELLPKHRQLDWLAFTMDSMTESLVHRSILFSHRIEFSQHRGEISESLTYFLRANSKPASKSPGSKKRSAIAPFRPSTLPIVCPTAESRV